MLNELCLYDAKKYNQPEGFVKVSCLVDEVIDDLELKGKIIGSLVDTPYVEVAVRLLEHRGATKESALKMCLEIANDLLESVEKIGYPVEEEEEEKGDVSSPELALQSSLKKLETRGKYRMANYRHPVVERKKYFIKKVNYFYADPIKMNQDALIHFVD